MQLLRHLVRNSLLSFLCLMVCATPGFAQTVNRIIAIVNDDIITEGDVASFVQALKDDPDNAQAPESQNGDLQRVVLQRLIDQRLILQEAKRLELMVPSEAVLERYDAFRNRFPSDELFHQSLRETGLSEEQLKRRVREQLTIQRAIDAKVRATITVSPQEVSKELSGHPEMAKSGDRMRVSHLLIRISEHRNEAQAKELAANLQKQIEVGASNFADAARRYSEDQFRNDGGNMGWVASGELMPELDAVLAGLAGGKVSEPVQSRLGFHILRIEERKSAASLPVTDANNSVYQQLYQEKFQKTFVRWMNELRQKAYIDLPGQSGS